MALIDFQVSPSQLWANTFPFGGGHTTETDPTRRGWKFRAQGACVLFGRKGIKGCFSAMSLGDGRLDVALYEDHTPREVSEWLKKERGNREELDPLYKQVHSTSGWALFFIQVLEAYESGKPDAMDMFYDRKDARAR